METPSSSKETISQTRADTSEREGQGDQRASNPTFSVVMPVYNERGHLRETLSSVLAALEAYGHGEFIVVDNGSTDGSWQILQELQDDLTALLRRPDATVSAARNAGASRANGDYLAFVDADCIVVESYFYRAAEVFSEISPAAAGSWYRPSPDAGWLERTWYRLHALERRGSVASINGGNLIVDERAFWRVGGFEEELQTGEDAELCQKLRDQGFDLYEAPALEAVHLGNPDTVTSFYRQQVWHAIGMSGTMRGWIPDRPTAALLLHVLLVGGATAAALCASRSPETIATATASGILVVPASTVLYRWFRTGRLTNPIASLFLYEVYYLARAQALLLLLTGSAESYRK